MYLHFYRRFQAAITLAAIFSILAGCATQYVDGLVLVVEDSVIAVSRLDAGDGSVIVPNKRARFAFKQPIGSGQRRDLAVFAQGSGTLVVHLFSSAKEKQPVASASFYLIEGKKAELRMAIPDGADIALAELGMKEGGSATITAFSVVPTFIGARFGATSYVVSNRTTYISGTGSETTALTLVLPGGGGFESSLIVKLAGDGTAKISISAQDGVLKPAFEATARAGVEVAIPLAALQSSTLQRPGRVTVESEIGLASVWLAPGGGAPGGAALLADLHAILAATAPLDGDFALYRWDLIPETLVFDFADYTIQDSYLKRLAFFAEKPGFRGRIASDDEIAALHGWNAHDYSPETLAAFFSKAQDSAIKLNNDEVALLELLIAHGVLTRTASGVIGKGRGAIISVSRESTPGLRRMFMDHESSHALFFQDEEYRKLSASLWSSLGPEATRFWMQHLAWRRYDTRDEYLRINELQAYLVQQPVSSVKTYYEALLVRLADAHPADMARLESDAPYVLDSAVAGAVALDSYLRKRWGLSAGKFGRIRKL